MKLSFTLSLSVNFATKTLQNLKRSRKKGNSSTEL